MSFIEAKTIIIGQNEIRTELGGHGIDRISVPESRDTDAVSFQTERSFVDGHWWKVITEM